MANFMIPEERSSSVPYPSRNFSLARWLSTGNSARVWGFSVPLQHRICSEICYMEFQDPAGRLGPFRFYCLRFSLPSPHGCLPVELPVSIQCRHYGPNRSIQ